MDQTKRILIVEDYDGTRALYADALEAAGFDVLQARDGMEALERAKQTLPDVVLLDIGLPRLDGFYVAELWKRDPSMSRVPVVAISAHSNPDYESRALAAGCQMALSKPCGGRELLAAIRKVLSRP
jgi:two-component system cell cycle response regulator DivK